MGGGGISVTGSLQVAPTKNNMQSKQQMDRKTRLRKEIAGCAICVLSSGHEHEKDLNMILNRNSDRQTDRQSDRQ